MEFNGAVGRLTFLGILQVVIGYVCVILNVSLLWISIDDSYPNNGLYGFLGGMWFFVVGMMGLVSKNVVSFNGREILASTMALAGTAFVSAAVIVFGVLEISYNWKFAILRSTTFNNYHYLIDKSLSFAPLQFVAFVKVVGAMVTIVLASAAAAVAVACTFLSCRYLSGGSVQTTHDAEGTLQRVPLVPENGEKEESAVSVAESRLDFRRASLILGFVHVTIGCSFLLLVIVNAAISGGPFGKIPTEYVIFGGMMVVAVGIMNLMSRDCESCSTYLTNGTILMYVIVSWTIPIVLYHSICEAFKGYIFWQYSNILIEVPTMNMIRLAVGTVSAILVVVEGVVSLINCALFCAIQMKEDSTSQRTTTSSYSKLHSSLPPYPGLEKERHASKNEMFLN